MLDDSQLRKLMKSVADPKLPTSPAPEGQRLGKFTLVERLASNTWRGIEEGRSRSQVIRILGPEPAQPEFRALCADLRALSKLRHPVILPWHKLSAVGGIHFVLRDYVDGRSLAQAVPAPREAIQVCYEIARALEQAHGLELVHGALTPSNVILDGGGRPFIVDFGIPSLKTHFRRPGSTLFQAWSSPRDISSLGSLFWRALAGVDAPEIGRPAPHLQSVAPEVDSAVDAAARRFLGGSPKPFATAHEVAEDLGHILSAMPSGTGGTALIDKVKRARETGG